MISRKSCLQWDRLESLSHCRTILLEPSTAQRMRGIIESCTIEWHCMSTSAALLVIPARCFVWRARNPRDQCLDG
jgi:hypothetical protein